MKNNLSINNIIYMSGYFINEAFNDISKEEHFGFIKSFVKNIKSKIKGGSKSDKMKKLQERLKHMPVIIYDNCNFKGNRKILKVKWYASLPQFNDKISSIRVMPGFKATFYEHPNYIGNYITVTKEVSCLINNNWNNRISSIKVEKLTVPGGDKIKTGGINIDKKAKRLQEPTMKKISSKVGSIKAIKIIKPKPVKINSKLGKNIKMPKTKKIFEDFTVEIDNFRTASFIIFILLIVFVFYYFKN